MAAPTRKAKLFLLTFAIQYFSIKFAESRIHKLKIENDSRREFALSTFGFYRGGFLKVNVTSMKYSLPVKDDIPIMGFTLDKTSSDGMSPYLENHQMKCILTTPMEVGHDNTIFVVKMPFMFEKSKIRIDRPRQVLDRLSISPSINPHAQKNITRMKRDESVEKSTDSSVVLPKATTAADVAGTAPAEVELWDHIHFTNECTDGREGVDCAISFDFTVEINRKEEEGLYNLFFHNCPTSKSKTSANIRFDLELVEHNIDSYLSAGALPLPSFFFFSSIAYVSVGVIWCLYIRKHREIAFKIHYLMASLVFLKSISLLFHGINFYYIGKDGHATETWAVLYYVIHLLKGAVLFVTIILIGAGWTFIKHILSDKEKKIFMVVIPLQVLANVAQIIIEESEEGESEYTTWKEVFIVVDLLCCGAILFPVVWSIRHLQDASHTDGKAAINLEKLKLFRHFYIMIVCYIYFTRIIVYLLKITVPYMYEWCDELFKELATMTFFVVTGYKFRPVEHNPYLSIPTDSDDDMEMDAVLTETGMTENLKRVSRTAGPERRHQANNETSLDDD